MELIIDANILISGLIATEGMTYDLIFNDKLHLFSVEFLIDELQKHQQEVLKKSGLSAPDFEMFLSLVSSRIEFVPVQEFKAFIPEAERITPDPDDTEYLALALKLRCDIWSNDKRLKNQARVKVYSTAEIINLLKE